MRKGIGWGLRDAGRSFPDQVRTFVAEHRGDMAPLSVREALKHL
jgi:3-methyladenine DNA glycosylase AlkD